MFVKRIVNIAFDSTTAKHVSVWYLFIIDNHSGLCWMDAWVYSKDLDVWACM